jgi:hypothetical protein
MVSAEGGSEDGADVSHHAFGKGSAVKRRHGPMYLQTVIHVKIGFKEGETPPR